MTFPTSSDDLRGLAEIQTEIDQLEKQDAELQSALDDVDHETRRCNDALERAGWRAGEPEIRAAMLAESRKAIVDDREKNRTRRAQLTERLALVRIRLNDDEHDD